MKIYKGKYLAITYEVQNSLFIQYWYNSPDCINDFKKEMLAYTLFYEEFRPMYTLWLQQKFTLHLDQTIQLWIEEMVNKPCYTYGNKKCAFVVSKDILAHVSVINSFEKTKSCIVPIHFTTEQEARQWLTNSVENTRNYKKSKIIYEGVDQEGNMIIKLPCQNIKSTLKFLNESIEQEQFILENEYKYHLLTQREKEILSLIAEGKKHQQIAEKLFISLHTVRTHWKNTKAKLKIQNKDNFLAFLKAFKN
ncbi:response regulator transcription factor [Aquimarina sp. AU119]|uniref:response regulator transcription factor n=1 Tax=Aquimarina sp. AU119 TaxID=2108528 RepID=UPI00190EBC0D|nr:helix-turn-helix transcriptional regulator [Aquimarina sp. AU119]